MLREITDYPNYSISDTGYVINNVTGRKLKQYNKISRNSGYFCVYLYNENGRKCFFIHRLVADAYIQNPHGFCQVNHRDENTHNNAVSNLEWCDCHYNANYGSRKKRLSNQFSGNGNPFYGKHHTDATRLKQSKVKQGQASNNRRKVIVNGSTVYDSLSDCSKALGISLTQVFNIINGYRRGTEKIEYVEENYLCMNA